MCRGPNDLDKLSVFNLCRLAQIKGKAHRGCPVYIGLSTGKQEPMTQNVSMEVALRYCPPSHSFFPGGVYTEDSGREVSDLHLTVQRHGNMSNCKVEQNYIHYVEQSLSVAPNLHMLHQIGQSSCCTLDNAILGVEVVIFSSALVPVRLHFPCCMLLFITLKCALNLPRGVFLSSLASCNHFSYKKKF